MFYLKPHLKFLIKNIKFFKYNMNHTLVAVGQMTSTNDKTNNFKQIINLVEMAKTSNAKMLFLPEACDYICETPSSDFAEPLDGRFISDCQQLALKNNLWLSLGGVHEKIKNDKKIYNTHVVIDNEGQIKSTYRKMHLFDVNIPEKFCLEESKLVLPGSRLVKPIQTPIGKLALSICYDVRFCELSIALRHAGAEILTYPSAFTYDTGLVHWETLLRSRAIENQCYVIAPAQIGQHNKKRKSFGQAMIIDPWGKILGECEKFNESNDNYKPCICLGEIDLNYLNEVRERMPILQHKRYDLYGNILDNCLLFVDDRQDDEQYQFGHVNILNKFVFYKTKLSFAFVNLRCVVPGHVLVAPLKKLNRLPDLSKDEISDLFQTVIKVQKVVETVYNSCSSTVTVQDGEHAGQTIKHVHVHILPRVPGDFLDNDDIYGALAKHDKEPFMSKPRCDEEMEKEAQLLKSYF